MSASVLFAAGLSTTFLISIGVVCYLSSPLRKQLLQLCGNAERAEFWTVFSNTTLALVPTVFAMQVDAVPDAGVPAVFAVVGQASGELQGWCSPCSSWRGFSADLSASILSHHYLLLPSKAKVGIYEHVNHWTIDVGSRRDSGGHRVRQFPSAEKAPCTRRTCSRAGPSEASLLCALALHRDRGRTVRCLVLWICERTFWRESARAVLERIHGCILAAAHVPSVVLLRLRDNATAQGPVRTLYVLTGRSGWHLGLGGSPPTEMRQSC